MKYISKLKAGSNTSQIASKLNELIEKLNENTKEQLDLQKLRQHNLGKEGVLLVRQEKTN